jgi:hypothetical protein
MPGAATMGRQSDMPDVSRKDPLGHVGSHVDDAKVLLLESIERVELGLAV